MYKTMTAQFPSQRSRTQKTVYNATLSTAFSLPTFFLHCQKLGCHRPRVHLSSSSHPSIVTAIIYCLLLTLILSLNLGCTLLDYVPNANIIDDVRCAMYPSGFNFLWFFVLGTYLNGSTAREYDSNTARVIKATIASGVLENGNDSLEARYAQAARRQARTRANTGERLNTDGCK
ncbi:hypothetical protein DFH09DRAFT_1396677 [Mycena vulgaris]|nr:hypothetical protein DFH09DRAFT_1396677 [Mycena vulgaris]